MRFLFAAVIILVLNGCSKNGAGNIHADELYVISPWLEKKMKDDQNCVCISAIFAGRYESKKVYELRGVDPLCNTINIVYKEDGTPWFYSSDLEKYDDYFSTATNFREIWRCTRNDN